VGWIVFCLRGCGALGALSWGKVDSERSVGHTMKANITADLLLALVTASCASSPPAVDPDVQPLFLPANRSLQRTTAE